MNEELKKSYEQYCLDVIEAAHNDDGDIIPEYVKAVNSTMDTYAKLIDSESRIEEAKIKAEADISVAKYRSATDGISGGVGAVVDIAKIIANSVNMKSVIWAEESANKICNSKFLGFIKKQP